MQIWNEDGQASLFAPDGCAGKMSSACSAAARPKARTSAWSSTKSLELKAIPYMSLDLTPGHGDLLGRSYWEIRSPWLGGSSMLNTGPAPLSAENVYSLSQILEGKPLHKYYLSKKACLGILRRAKERGKDLPPRLEKALLAQAGMIPWPVKSLESDPSEPDTTDDCLTPWDTQRARIYTPESIAPTLTGADSGGGRNPAGLLFAAGFCAGAAPSAGGIGYQEERAPTLKAAGSGTNMVPSVLCLNDQGGGHIECSEDVTGTLRAQEHGHQPIVVETASAEDVLLFENHGVDGRYTGPHAVSPTLSARAGTGGNNLPLALQAAGFAHAAGCGRRSVEGSDAHASLDCQEVFSRQRVDKFKVNNVASTESARQQKDATDLVLQNTEAERPLLIRRLCPRECERLQGFPDGWTDLPNASDSARYRALGNSVAIPCVEFIMRGIAMAAGFIEDNTSRLFRDHSLCLPEPAHDAEQ